MRVLAIITTGFVLGGLVTGGLVYAAHAWSPENGSTVVMAPGMMTNGTQPMAPAAYKLAIVHVQRGCHEWADGKHHGAMMKITLRQGARLSILDQDVDPHQLVQLGGPKLQLGRPMMPGDGTQVLFAKAGTYRLKTKTLEMPGMAEVETTGPDNTLMLTVRVV
ncbi:MAG: hypothetical protein ABI649_06060 [Gaiellaceae bacterium]